MLHSHKAKLDEFRIDCIDPNKADNTSLVMNKDGLSVSKDGKEKLRISGEQSSLKGSWSFDKSPSIPVGTEDDSAVNKNQVSQLIRESGLLDASLLDDHNKSAVSHEDIRKLIAEEVKRAIAAEKANADAIATKANDTDVVHKSGNETITGLKCFEDSLMFGDAYPSHMEGMGVGFFHLKALNTVNGSSYRFSLASVKIDGTTNSRLRKPTSFRIRGGMDDEILATMGDFSNGNITELSVLPLGTTTALGAPAYGLHVSATGGLQLFGTHFLNGDIWTDDSVKMVKGNVSLTSTDTASIGFDYANKVVFRTMPNDGTEATYEFQAWQWDDDSHTTKSPSAGVKFLKPSQKSALESTSVLNMQEGDARWGSPDLSGYLTKNDAVLTYLTKKDAESTYLTQTAAGKNYMYKVPHDYLGFNEFGILDSIAKATPFVNKLIFSELDDAKKAAISEEFSRAVDSFIAPKGLVLFQYCVGVKTHSLSVSPLIAKFVDKAIFIDFCILEIVPSQYLKGAVLPKLDCPVVLPNLEVAGSAAPIPMPTFDAEYNNPVWFPNLRSGGHLFYNCSYFDQPVILPKLFSGKGMFNGTAMSPENIAITLRSLPLLSSDKNYEIGFDCDGMACTISDETFVFSETYTEGGYYTYDRTINYSLENCPTFDNDDEDQTLRKAFVIAVNRHWRVTTPTPKSPVAVAMLLDDEEPSEPPKWYKLEKTEYGEVKDSNGVRYTINECNAAWSREGLNVGYTQFPSRTDCLESWGLTELTEEELFPPEELQKVDD